MKHLFIAACCCLASAGFAAEPFEIRGVLPWHNFLCGPTAWNKADYEAYLDNCKAEGINFIGFHNYTGGGERYATYVEPMVRISYRGIVPQAMLDNSLQLPLGRTAAPAQGVCVRLAAGARRTARRRSLRQRLLPAFENARRTLPQHTAADARRTAHGPRPGYRNGHGLRIRRRAARIFPLYAAGSCFFWLGAGNMVPNPCHPTSVELHRAALDDLLENYPDIDYVWLWLNEHSFLGVVVEQALGDPAFAEVFRRESGHFEEAQSDSERFVGVWSLEYIRRTLDHLRQKGSRAKLIIGGWGGGGQLPGILRGLDRALPEEVVFSCLNPPIWDAPDSPDSSPTSPATAKSGPCRGSKATTRCGTSSRAWARCETTYSWPANRGFRAWRPFIGARQRPAITSARSPATPAHRTMRPSKRSTRSISKRISARRPPPHSRP